MRSAPPGGAPFARRGLGSGGQRGGVTGSFPVRLGADAGSRDPAGAWDGWGAPGRPDDHGDARGARGGTGRRGARGWERGRVLSGCRARSGVAGELRTRGGRDAGSISVMRRERAASIGRRPPESVPIPPRARPREGGRPARPPQGGRGRARRRVETFHGVQRPNRRRVAMSQHPSVRMAAQSAPPGGVMSATPCRADGPQSLIDVHTSAPVKRDPCHERHRGSRTETASVRC